jgi:hypothetical protein
MPPCPQTREHAFQGRGKAKVLRYGMMVVDPRAISFTKKEPVMTPLRKRMIEAMELRNFAPKTIELYVDNVWKPRCVPRQFDLPSRAKRQRPAVRRASRGGCASSAGWSDNTHKCRFRSPSFTGILHEPRRRNDNFSKRHCAAPQCCADALWPGARIRQEAPRTAPGEEKNSWFSPLSRVSTHRSAHPSAPNSPTKG